MTNAVPRIWGDFNNADRHGRVRLNTVGALRDIAAQQLALYDGMRVVLSDSELVADGTIRFSHDEGWVAEVDWSRVVEVGKTTE